MISSHYSHIATLYGAYLFSLKNWFLFINVKFSSFAVVIFACELIPAVGAPAALPDCFEPLPFKCLQFIPTIFRGFLGYLAENSAIWQECLLYQTREKAADAHTTGEQHLGHFKLFRIVPVADSATQSHPRGGSATELRGFGYGF
jgi:hypothetical protein